MSILQNILIAVACCSGRQLSERWKAEAEKLDGASDEDIKAFFKKLYEESCHESSSFIKTLVDPKYTDAY